jgi:hypothetical protein
MIGLWSQLPQWADYLIRGLMMSAMLCVFAVAVSRTGRSPYWALLALLPVPFLLPVLVWIAAFMPWTPPVFKKRRK